MTFIRREKRFFAYMSYMGQEVLTYCCNPGKMTDILVLGARCIVTAKSQGIPYEWQAVEIDGQWIGINTANPNRLALPLIQSLFQENFTPEKRFGQYRADFASNTTIIEIKHVHWKPTAPKLNTAYFPDCVTTRGARQLMDLQALSQTHHCYVIYIIQRSDVNAMAIADWIDPTYHANHLTCDSVQKLAFNCKIDLNGIRIHKQISMLT